MWHKISPGRMHCETERIIICRDRKDGNRAMTTRTCYDAIIEKERRSDTNGHLTAYRSTKAQTILILNFLGTCNYINSIEIM